MSSFSLAEILRPELSELTAYVPNQGEFPVRLDANEAPPLLSAAARRKLAEAAADISWERYPDATASALRRSLAQRSGVRPDELLVGVGSDEIIALLLTALSRPQTASDTATVVTTSPTFVMYRLSARARGLRILEVPLDDRWDLATDSLTNALSVSPPNLIFIATPNNPTGNLMSRDRLELLIRAAEQALVIVDEAYISYAPRDHLDLFRKYPNVALLRTLSKLGFASLRLGYLIGNAELIAALNKVRAPYNVSTLTQRLGRVVVEDLWAEVESNTRAVMEERVRLGDELGKFPDLQVQPSHANFLWVRTERPALEYCHELEKRGVLVRSFHERGGRLAQHLRITVGTRAENDALLSALSDIRRS